MVLNRFACSGIPDQPRADAYRLVRPSGRAPLRYVLLLLQLIVILLPISVFENELSTAVRRFLCAILGSVLDARYDGGGFCC